MTRYLRLEMQRALVSEMFVLGLVLATVAGLTGALPELRFGQSDGALYMFRSFYSSSIALLAPVLATIPFAQSYAAERNDGFMKALLQRMPKHLYAVSKLATNALAGGLVLAIPVTGALLWTVNSFPIVADPNGYPNVFGNLIVVQPVAFMWIAVGISFVFGATFATAGLAISSLFRSPYYANVVPLALYIVPAFFLGNLGLGFLDPPMMWEPSSNTNTTPVTVGIQYALFLLVSVVVFLLFLRAKEE